MAYQSISLQNSVFGPGADARRSAGERRRRPDDGHRHDHATRIMPSDRTAEAHGSCRERRAAAEAARRRRADAGRRPRAVEAAQRSRRPRRLLGETTRKARPRRRKKAAAAQARSAGGQDGRCGKGGSCDAPQARVGSSQSTAPALPPVRHRRLHRLGMPGVFVHQARFSIRGAHMRTPVRPERPGWPSLIGSWTAAQVPAGEHAHRGTNSGAGDIRPRPDRDVEARAAAPLVGSGWSASARSPKGGPCSP